ncbi:TPA: HEPN domain-containing protein [Candidatus Bipolaricaulota bacterium]|nr:HEPN domain-containing protein [Candidatus Bipolaricaulota bacterium]
MTNETLARSYLKKATDRLDILDLLSRKGAYSDVVREAQEIVELALKGMLRFVGIEPPKFHDVGGLLLEHSDKYPEEISKHLERMARISKRLRKERELSFYGDIDFIPTEEYTLEDAEEAAEGANFVVEMARRLMGEGSGGERSQRGD